MADLATTVARYRDSATAGQQRYADGVQATTKDVTGLAIAAQPKLLNNFTQSVTSGHWARRLGAVGNQGWKNATVAKAANYGVGIQAGLGKYQTAMQTWLPIIDSASAQVQSMPNATFQDSIARATAFMTILHQAKLAQ